MNELKISSYNIHSCIGTNGLYSVSRVASTIKLCDTDVVCLQEIEVNSTFVQTRVWSRSHCDDQPALLGELAGYKYHEFVPAIQSKASGWKEVHKPVNDNASSYGRFGIAILSKYPIVQTRIHRYKQYKRKTLRNAMTCLLLLPDGLLVWIVNTHLGCHIIGREQFQQAQELVSFTNSLDRKIVRGVIVCGDFNSPPLYKCTRYLKQCGFLDVWEKLGRGWGGTFPSESRLLGLPCCAKKMLRLDYIFLMKSEETPMICKYVYVQDMGVDCLLASDHLPLCALMVLVS